LCWTSSIGKKPTIQQLIQRLAVGRGHHVIAGTPEQIADAMQTWFENGAADGFNVMPPYFPGGFDYSPPKWFRSCAAAACSAKTIPERPCAIILAFRGRKAVMLTFCVNRPDAWENGSTPGPSARSSSGCR
jgi:hypothetical protein